MKVGDLVRYKDDGDIGLIMSTGWATGEVQVQWGDGTMGFHLESEMEVLDG